MKRGLTIAALILVPLGCAGMTGAVWIVEAPVRLAIGWIPFLVDAVGRVRWDPPSILASLAVSALFVFGVHRLGTWLRAPDKQWSRKTTFALSGLLGLAFVASMASMGVVHQLGWLAASNEKLLDSGWDKRKHTTAARTFCRGLRTALAAMSDEEPASVTLSKEAARQSNYLAIPRGNGEFLLLPIDPQRRLADGAFTCDAKGELSEPLAEKDWIALVLSPDAGHPPPQ